ncbi:MAG: pyruvate kinase [Candidatus Moranbacteria bacterium]|nr:pyruvate kinase [Candidatus Moranbacteria bacterium]
MKNTKIVATIGPASEDKETLRRMIEAGMNVARLNFSHGEYAWFEKIIARLRELSEEMRVPVAILADMQGPRIRVEVDREISLKRGERIHVADISHRETFSKSRSRQPICYLDVPKMASKLSTGDMILIEDGLIELQVVAKHGAHAVEATALSDCRIKNRKGVILPDTPIDLPILSKKDLRDLAFVLREGVDYVGLSFVGSAEDIHTAREEMRKVVGEEAELPKIIAKIERKTALKHLKSILKTTDAVMVARGDLGIEMPTSEVVLLQKEIIRESLRAMKPVIVATQMMKSMTDNIRPTRAEVSDVSNAVIDHTDAVMLSEESAMGKYPVETIAMMAEIIEKTEESPFNDIYQELDVNMKNEYAAVIRSAYQLAKSFNARAILLLSMSGLTARLISHFRPETEILVATDSKKTWYELALVWGIQPFNFEGDPDRDHYIDRMMSEAKKSGKLAAGDDTVVFLGKTPDRRTVDLVGIQRVR